MPRPKRSDQTDLLNEIKETAWAQIAENGAAALSLRAIARALHITAPAIYHYYPSRDDLVTALIVDAFTSMGDAQYSALQSTAESDHEARLMALGLAYRQWALVYPQRYQLIFGTPIPGYHAPEEVTQPAAARSLLPLIGCLDAAWKAGGLRFPAGAELPEGLRQELETWRMVCPVGNVVVLYAALVVWSRVHGLVSLEIGSQFPALIEEVDTLYRQQMDRLITDALVL
jgi:AcrR family transcriptional regulator